MDNMKFVFPHEWHEEKAIAYIQEFRDHNSAINGGGVLEAEFYSEYYKEVVQRYRIHL